MSPCVCQIKQLLGTFKFLSKYIHLMLRADRAADMHRENMKKKRRELEQASLDAASDLLDTDSNATFAMASHYILKYTYNCCLFSLPIKKKTKNTLNNIKIFKLIQFM